MPADIPTRKQTFLLNAKYKAFLANGAKPNDNFSNPRNLFDDSNKEDRKWLTIARRYLSKRALKLS
jgi:hypothetical protein